jgi:hypothetical protein
MPWYGNNEDAGDLRAANDAGYAESCAEDAAAESEEAATKYGPKCGWCGEDMVDAVFVQKGTIGEDTMCRGCAEDVEAIPCGSDGYEDFGADHGIGPSDPYTPYYPF